MFIVATLGCIVDIDCIELSFSRDTSLDFNCIDFNIGTIMGINNWTYPPHFGKAGYQIARINTYKTITNS